MFLKVLQKFYHSLVILECSTLLYVLLFQEECIYKLFIALIKIVFASRICCIYGTLSKLIVFFGVLYVVKLMFAFYSNIDYFGQKNIIVNIGFILYVIKNFIIIGLKFKYALVLTVLNKLYLHINIALKNCYCACRNDALTVAKMTTLHQKICVTSRLFNQIMSLISLTTFCQCFVGLSAELYIVVSCFYYSVSSTDWQNVMSITYYLIIEDIVHILLLLVPAVACKKAVSYYQLSLCVPFPIIYTNILCADSLY